MTSATGQYEVTVALIKSKAIEAGHESGIMKRIMSSPSLSIRFCQRGLLTERTASEFYAEHRGRPYFDGLIRSVTGPDGVTIVILGGVDAIKTWRTMLGATNPEQAAPGTIRHDFGAPLPDNAAHGSDSPAAALREADILLRATGILGPNTVEDSEGRLFFERLMGIAASRS